MKIQLLKDLELLQKRKINLERQIQQFKETIKMLEENKKIIEKRIEITKEIIGDEKND